MTGGGGKRASSEEKDPIPSALAGISFVGSLRKWLKSEPQSPSATDCGFGDSDALRIKTFVEFVEINDGKHSKRQNHTKQSIGSGLVNFGFPQCG
jgi:hypothetical protein